MTFNNITILGDGAMATVCAKLVDSNNHRVKLWCPFPENAALFNRANRNEKYLPDFPLPPSLLFVADPQQSIENADLILSAIPTQYIRSVWERFAPIVGPNTPIVSVAKGIENDTLLRPTQIIADVLNDNPDAPPRPLASLSGPSIASELARCLPATLCAASDDEAFAAQLQTTFTTHWMRVYTNSDLVGVELAGATKNVIAIAAGIIDGLNAGYNAKSALLSRGLAEINRLGLAMGAQSDTFFGITGVGDLATTCFSPEGRNRSAGELLGKGLKLDDVLAQIKGVVEGVPTTRSVIALAEKYKVEMPITAAVHDVLFENLDPIQAISRLMSREPKSESID